MASLIGTEECERVHALIDARKRDPNCKATHLTDYIKDAAPRLVQSFYHPEDKEVYQMAISAVLCGSARFFQANGSVENKRVQIAASVQNALVASGIAAAAVALMGHSDVNVALDGAGLAGVVAFQNKEASHQLIAQGAIGELVRLAGLHAPPGMQMLPTLALGNIASASVYGATTVATHVPCEQIFNWLESQRHIVGTARLLGAIGASVPNSKKHLCASGLVELLAECVERERLAYCVDRNSGYFGRVVALLQALSRFIPKHPRAATQSIGGNLIPVLLSVLVRFNCSHLWCLTLSLVHRHQANSRCVESCAHDLQQLLASSAHRASAIALLSSLHGMRDMPAEVCRTLGLIVEKCTACALSATQLLCAQTRHPAGRTAVACGAAPSLARMATHACSGNVGDVALQTLECIVETHAGILRNARVPGALAAGSRLHERLLLAVVDHDATAALEALEAVTTHHGEATAVANALVAKAAAKAETAADLARVMAIVEKASPNANLAHLQERHAVFARMEAHADAGVDFEPPPEQVCPITYDVMRNPVMASDGHTYERDAIAAVLARPEPLSPMTREPLTPTLLPNHALRNAIQAHRERVLAIADAAASATRALTGKKRVREE